MIRLWVYAETSNDANKIIKSNGIKVTQGVWEWTNQEMIDRLKDTHGAMLVYEGCKELPLEVRQFLEARWTTLLPLHCNCVNASN